MSLEESFAHLPLALQWIFVVVVGAAFGSFLSVVCYRMPRGQSLIVPSSRTTDFKSPIPWTRNLPIISYLWARGRAETTGRRYSLRYLVLEVTTALVFVAIYLVQGWNIGLVFSWLVAVILLAAAFIDLELKQIPDLLTWGAWGLMLFLALFGAQAMPLSLTHSVIGGLVGFLSFWLIMQAYYWVTGEDGLGFGDVKFMGFIGAALGAKAILEVTIFASLTGLAVALFLMVFQGKNRRSAIPFGPFLAAGALALLLDFSALELFLEFF